MLDPIEFLYGAFDLHIHYAPDVVMRPQNIDEIAFDALNAGVSGLLLKSHMGSTTGLAWAMNQRYQGNPQMLGSLTLNYPVGGFNPFAVEAALRTGAAIIFFPTYCAAHHLSCNGNPIPVEFPRPANFTGLTIYNEQGKILPEVFEILELIKSYNAILGTGHISPMESIRLVREAKRVGVRKMIVSHASSWVPDMPLDIQKEAVELGAFIEHSGTHITPDESRLENAAFSIATIGADRIILSSDYGKMNHGPWTKAFSGFLYRLYAKGITDSEISRMAGRNPKSLLE